ncbi:MAG: hypothetical protein H7A36_05595 [Chlamydiales bacterium]|nr:hypothetical protein [Chlamydiales bacterium]
MLPLVEELTPRQKFEKRMRAHSWEKANPALLSLINELNANNWLSIGSHIPIGRRLEEVFPFTSLPDGEFEAIACLDVIAELDTELYRLALSELARLLQPEGWLVCSTSLDTQTLEPAAHFKALIETEFVVKKIVKRYLRFGRFFERATEIFFKNSGCSYVTLVAQKKRLF